MGLNLGMPRHDQPFVEQTRLITRPWLAFLQKLVGPGSGGVAPANAEYLVGAANSNLTAERVVTNTPTVTWDLATLGQAKANVVPKSVAVAVDAAGALDGDGTTVDPLGVRVDGSSVTINGSNQLQAAVASLDETFLTATDESGTLTNSRQLIAGTNVTFDDGTPNQRTVNVASSGGGGDSGGHIHGMQRVLGDGSTTAFDLLDLAEYLEHVGVGGSFADPATFSLSSDRSQIVFASAPSMGDVIALEYVVATV